MQDTIKLGIAIPHYVNNEVCDIQLKKLLNNLKKQINNDVIIVIVEDGQITKWIDDYGFIVFRNKENKGLSYSRNVGIDYLMDKVEYIGFIDSDDNVSDNYIEEILKYCDGINEKISTKMIKINHTNNETLDITNRTSVTGRNYRKDIIGDLRFKESVRLGEDNVFEHHIGKTQEVYCDAIYYYEFGVNENSLIMNAIRNQ